MKISVIFTTYNSPDWLEKVLWGFHYQSYSEFEIIVADDGSGNDTRQRINQMRLTTGREIIHVWQPDEGFQKTRILNKAIQASSGDYLLFTDGDCIPRHDFVEVHVKQAQKGYFLSGGYFKLPMNISLAIDKHAISSGVVFEPDWLLERGLKKSHKLMKLTATGWQQQWLNRLTPANASWNGHNASGWRSDIIAANGFDERMQYGGEDRELGERLFNAGLQSKQIRYSAICLHLDHARSYVTPEMLRYNREIRQYTRQQHLTHTPFGIEQDQLHFRHAG
ncbi:glycosyltransferase family 2 protein [Neptunicella sp. SCSIO 80796]|uniref:glycosyltransferase family 2 protein n=1 Tax=Neptunicella plasticusilytica TaxID=3117012 RepID=UPI003A4E37A9